MSEAPWTLFCPRSVGSRILIGADRALEDGQVGQCAYAVGAVCVLGHSQSIDNGGSLGSAVERRGEPQFVGRDAGDAGHSVGVVVVERGAQLGEAGYAFSEKRLIHMPGGQEEIGEPWKTATLEPGRLGCARRRRRVRCDVDRSRPAGLPAVPAASDARRRVCLRGTATSRMQSVRSRSSRGSCRPTGRTPRPGQPPRAREQP